MVSEVLILGGGLAGGATALELARAGTPVRLLEREAGPHHKICGEFLSVEAQVDFERLGLDCVRLGAVPIDQIRLIRGTRRIEMRLPFVALGISRKGLDQALLDAALKAGAAIERGVKVTALHSGEASTSAGPRDSRHIFLATGKHDVRGLCRSRVRAKDDYVGFKMHWRLAPRQRVELKGAIELILFDGGYAGLQCIGDDVANLCLLVRRERLIEIGGGWTDLLALLMLEPHFARRLADAEALFSRPLTIANLPYGYRCGPDNTGIEGFFRIGDQAAVTAPLTGDGMAVALRSARMAVASLKAGAGPAGYHRLVRQQVARQVWMAMALQRMTERPLIMRAGLGAIRLWPGMLAALSRATRLPEWVVP